MPHVLCFDSKCQFCSWHNDFPGAMVGWDVRSFAWKKKTDISGTSIPLSSKALESVIPKHSCCYVFLRNAMHLRFDVALTFANRRHTCEKSNGNPQQRDHGIFLNGCVTMTIHHIQSETVLPKTRLFEPVQWLRFWISVTVCFS